MGVKLFSPKLGVIRLNRILNNLAEIQNQLLIDPSMRHVLKFTGSMMTHRFSGFSLLKKCLLL